MAAPTLANLKTHLGITGSTDDSELAVFLAAARSQIERRVGPLESTSFTEVVDARGSEFLLSHAPLLTITAVTGYGSAREPEIADLAVKSRAGVVFEVNGNAIVGRFAVTYTAGYATVPDALHLAVLVTARHLWNTKRGNTRRPVDDDSMQSSTGNGYALPWKALELCAPYDLTPGIA